MRQKFSGIYAADFETTVYEGQTETEVWSAAIVELNSRDVKVFHSIDEFMQHIFTLKRPLIYFHNLKFDGMFILDWLLRQKNFQNCVTDESNTSPDDMPYNSFRYSISAKMGQWYSMNIRTYHSRIEIRDSYKLMPFSLKVIGEGFKTEHKKLEMEYKGRRYAGCYISPDEMAYIKNDVLVLIEALEIMYSDGHNKLTIGACCMNEYKNSLIGNDLTPMKNGEYKFFFDSYKRGNSFNSEWDSYFPNLFELELDRSYMAESVGEYIRKAYRGGWCYLVKGKEGKVFHNGTTADVNSLYPSVMHSDSGSRYPVGCPIFWKGTIPEICNRDDIYYFIRFTCRFNIKQNMLPFVQIKHDWKYNGTESLETSDVLFDGKYYDKYRCKGSDEIHLIRPELTMTKTDFILFKEHYNIEDLTILDGCWFHTKIGIFDEYINKYAEIKMHSKGAKRTEAKLFLNNLYGKFATSMDSSYKMAYLDDTTDTIKFRTVLEADKVPGYIPIGAAITSYARNFTIRAAQKNYYGKDKSGFIYADTDSISCDIPAKDFKGITVDPVKFCCWKQETSWDIGRFVRQKTYMKHIVAEDLEPIEKPYWDVKCAGMPEHCKQLFLMSMRELEYNPEDLTETELEFVKTKRTMFDFDAGLIVPSKLLPKIMKGGIVLMDEDYTMKKSNFVAKQPKEKKV